ncbi:MerR family transcriptional regulator [Hansschlegelia sp. KR7-227]|uniref:MerR family transcriptional regulator n=1 Tax=Hansschlegelia sp. KR7-227 TaxID=3400914 RepID=UPI003C03B0C7
MTQDFDDSADNAPDGPAKGPEAFRTISEVAEELQLPQHVLRFWESRFPQIKPIKRGGGRRYYRPGDVDLLRGVKQLLYGEGYTIRGVQRILREQGGRRNASAVGALAAASSVTNREDRSPQPPAGLVMEAGPEMWAPAARRAVPPRSTASQGGDPIAPEATYAAESRPDEVVAPEPVSVRSGLTEDQAARLSAALAELEVCRSLLAKRL